METAVVRPGKRVRDNEAGSHHAGAKRKRIERPLESLPHRDPKNHSPVRELSKDVVSVPSKYEFANQTSQFSKGAIISLRLVNFQVATDSTFRFGPYLNFVLGSNGTGKSTIVNAIYLLFRGNIQDLDRRNYNEFIQHGKQYAVVSAQIQGELDERNPVIAMKVFRRERLPGETAVKPQWFVNGEPQTEEMIDLFIMKFHVQVNNLCQFLPQFRVAAFSGESAQQRLKSTERAIGYEGMLDDHIKLADAGSTLSELTKDVDSLQEQIQKLREKKSILNEKIAQLDLANKDKEKANMLSHVYEVAKYFEAESELEGVKKELAGYENKLKEFDRDTRDKRALISSSEAEVSNLKQRLQTDEQSVAETRRSYGQYMRRLSHQRNRVEDVLLRIRDVKAALETLTLRLDRLNNEYQETKLEVSELRKELNSMGSDTSQFQTLVTEMRNVETKYTEAEAASRALGSDHSTSSRKLAIAHSEKRELEIRMSQLEKSQNSMRSPVDIREVLRGDNGSMERSIAFVEKHQHLFEKPVIMPALISLNITDPSLLPLFSEVVSMIHLQKFVCQSARDQRLLTELAAKHDGLDVKTTYVASAVADLDPDTLSRLKSMGFEGVLSDKLDGPEPMLTFMKSLGLSRVPYSRSSIRSEVRDKIKSATHGAMEFADNKTFYRVQRSKYGRKLATETSKLLNFNQPAWVKFMLRSDHSEEIRQTRTKIESLNTSISSHENSIETITKTIADTNDRLTELRAHLRQLKTKVGREEKLRERLERATSRAHELNQKLRQLRESKDESSKSLDDQVVILNAEVANVNKILEEMPAESISTLQSSYYTRLKQGAIIKDLENRCKYLTHALAIQRRKIEDKIRSLKEHIRSQTESRRELTSKYEEAVSWLRAKKKLKEGIDYAKSRSIIEIEDEINRLNAMVNLHDQRAESLSSVRQQLEMVETQLAEDERVFSLNSHKLSDLSRDSKELRTRWESGINDLVSSVSSKFTEMFTKLGCRGNVSLDRVDSLAVGTWGVDINLAFRREEETLSKLSKFRQSGGERAVSTAVYLLALQDMATAPFRVLDEINQGMDEANERMILKFFVDMACQPNPRSGKAQQYFLVTPKLISNMPCHPNMNTVFIFGGLAVGNSDKMIPPSRPDDRLALLEEEIESENESDDEK